MSLEQDIEWMNQCFKLAESTPKSVYSRKVGAIIVKDETIISSGIKQIVKPAPREAAKILHAEHNAIYGVQDKTLIRGATLYTTLEPCVYRISRGEQDFTLETCCDLILQSGIVRVVFVELDGNMQGKGEKRLLANGIQTRCLYEYFADQIRKLDLGYDKFGVSTRQILNDKRKKRSQIVLDEEDEKDIEKRFKDLRAKTKSGRLKVRFEDFQ